MKKQSGGRGRCIFEAKKEEGKDVQAPKGGRGLKTVNIPGGKSRRAQADQKKYLKKKRAWFSGPQNAGKREEYLVQDHYEKKETDAEAKEHPGVILWRASWRLTQTHQKTLKINLGKTPDPKK